MNLSGPGARVSSAPAAAVFPGVPRPSSRHNYLVLVIRALAGAAGAWRPGTRAPGCVQGSAVQGRQARGVGKGLVLALSVPGIAPGQPTGGQPVHVQLPAPASFDYYFYDPNTERLYFNTFALAPLYEIITSIHTLP